MEGAPWPVQADRRETALPLRRYHLGCPFWSFGDWNGRLYTPDARPADRLAQYARVFNAVEGNTTFWSAPSAESVRRWRDAVDESFRFCFKLPYAPPTTDPNQGRLLVWL